MQRVAITGMGCVSPLGLTVDAFWEACRAGRSGIGPISAFDPTPLHARNAAEARDFDPAGYFGSKQLTLIDRFTQLGLAAADQAIAQAGIEFGPELARRTAVVIGTGVGGMSTLDENYHRLYAERATRLPPFTIPKLMVNAAVSHITMRFGVTGPAWAVASACSSANHAIGNAFNMVRTGQCEVAVTGGAEATITLGTLKGWEALRVMSPDTCRPFSKGRRGMILGEGAAVFVLESFERAKARGAPILAEIAGFGMSSDAGDLVQPSAEGAAAAIRMAIDDARLAPDDVDYINAHGTGTVANDPTETRAIRQVFGAHADRLAVSSTKSMHGHALGAAGAIELVATIKALADQLAPPTANFLEPDPDCDLDYVPNAAREMKIEAAVSNSFAFGGLNAVLAVKAAP